MPRYQVLVEGQWRRRVVITIDAPSEVEARDAAEAHVEAHLFADAQDVIALEAIPEDPHGSREAAAQSPRPP